MAHQRDLSMAHQRDLSVALHPYCILNARPPYTARWGNRRHAARGQHSGGAPALGRGWYDAGAFRLTVHEPCRIQSCNGSRLDAAREVDHDPGPRCRPLRKPPLRFSYFVHRTSVRPVSRERPEQSHQGNASATTDAAGAAASVACLEPPIGTFAIPAAVPSNPSW